MDLKKILEIPENTPLFLREIRSYIREENGSEIRFEIPFAIGGYFDLDEGDGLYLHLKGYINPPFVGLKLSEQDRTVKIDLDVIADYHSCRNCSFKIAGLPEEIRLNMEMEEYGILIMCLDKIIKNSKRRD